MLNGNSISKWRITSKHHAVIVLAIENCKRYLTKLIEIEWLAIKLKLSIGKWSTCVEIGNGEGYVVELVENNGFGNCCINNCKLNNGLLVTHSLNGPAVLTCKKVEQNLTIGIGLVIHTIQCNSGLGQWIVFGCIVNKG